MTHVVKTLGNGLCTLKISMSDPQVSHLSVYFQGKLNFHDCFWDGFQISATTTRNLTKMENAQSALKWIRISTFSDDKCPLFTRFFCAGGEDVTVFTVFYVGTSLKVRYWW